MLYQILSPLPLQVPSKVAIVVIRPSLGAVVLLPAGAGTCLARLILPHVSIVPCMLKLATYVLVYLC
jgi:hypothetical protein